MLLSLRLLRQKPFATATMLAFFLCCISARWTPNAHQNCLPLYILSDLLADRSATLRDFCYDLIQVRFRISPGGSIRILLYRGPWYFIFLRLAWALQRRTLVGSVRFSGSRRTCQDHREDILLECLRTIDRNPTVLVLESISP